MSESYPNPLQAVVMAALDVSVPNTATCKILSSPKWFFKARIILPRLLPSVSISTSLYPLFRDTLTLI